MSLRALLAIAAAGIPLGLAGVVTGPASAAAHPAITAAPAAMTYSKAGGLAGVAATSDRNAWAVGFAGPVSSAKVLMVHWNGRKWSRVTRPRVLTRPGRLSAITVVNARNAWAVGSTGSAAHPHTLIMHWDGRKWSRVTRPAPVANGSLTAVTANAKGGWAVGSHSTGPLVLQTSPVIFKLTGTRWSRVDPNFGKGSGVELDGVATTSAGTTFATGLYTGMITGVLARWHRSSWHWIANSWPEHGVYNWLNAIAGGPHGIAFAVGLKSGMTSGVVSIRWTGHAWVKAHAPSRANLYAVAFAPGGAAWTAGTYGSGSSSRTLVLRWNGHAWRRVTSPAKAAQLNGLGFATARYGWAVGTVSPYAVNSKTIIMHWNGRSWR